MEIPNFENAQYIISRAETWNHQKEPLQDILDEV